MAYKYYNPVDRGYIKFKLTKKQHNEVLPQRKIHWTEKYEYYYNEDQILLYKFYNTKAVILTTLLFPMAVLMHGVGNIKEIYRDHVRLFKQKQSGSFVKEHIWKSEKKYYKIMELIKNN